MSADPNLDLGYRPGDGFRHLASRVEEVGAFVDMPARERIPLFTRFELGFASVLCLAILTTPLWLQRGAHAEATAPTAFTLAQCTGPALNETTYITVKNDRGRLQFNCTTVSILGR